MREIKFRAWDKKQKRIIGNIGVFPNKGNAPSLSIGSDGILVHPNSKEFELMQFTGLQDSKGVDLYEGDILSGRDSRRNYEVVFELELCGWVFRIGRGPYWTNYSPDTASDLEVIGNIHQHPELLEG